MTTYRYDKSQDLFKKACKVIPCGIYGHMSPAPLIPATSYPFYVQSAKDARFIDVDGNEFIDYTCAYGPMVLGYNNPEIDEAARKQYELANCVSAPAPVMVELAEYLVDTVTIADWAFFAKNGNDVTSYALMVAKAETGRSKVVLIDGGYHGTAPWAQAPGHHGVADGDHDDIIKVPWNDFEAFERAVDRYPDEIAAFMATPYHHPTFADSVMPADGYWNKVEKLCRSKGIVIVVDDVRCGFRIDMRGSNEYFGFKPDLVCFCKAIANGYPLSALVGTDALKNAASKVFYTGSYWFSAAPMAASLATLKKLREIDGPKRMISTGKKLTDGLKKLAAENGFDLKVSGITSMPYMRITDDKSMMLHQDWCSECTRRGAYFTSHHNWFVSCAHTDEDVERTLEIAADAFDAVKKSSSKS